MGGVLFCIGKCLSTSQVPDSIREAEEWFSLALKLGCDAAAAEVFHKMKNKVLSTYLATKMVVWNLPFIFSISLTTGRCSATNSARSDASKLCFDWQC
jgi:hypothetical protein